MGEILEYTCIASSHTTKVSMGLIQLLILNKPLFFGDMWLGVDLRMDTKRHSMLITLHSIVNIIEGTCMIN
jgi:hypothetical protein